MCSILTGSTTKFYAKLLGTAAPGNDVNEAVNCLTEDIVSESPYSVCSIAKVYYILLCKNGSGVVSHYVASS